MPYEVNESAQSSKIHLKDKQPILPPVPPCQGGMMIGHNPEKGISRIILLRKKRREGIKVLTIEL
jgi:hypothetical protein